MTSDPTRSTGGFVRALVAVAASLSLVGGLAVAATAARWYSLRNVGVDEAVFHAQIPDDAGTNTYATGPCSERACNYLLLGTDSRAGLSAEQQTHFGDNSGHRRHLPRGHDHARPHGSRACRRRSSLSFPRDLWVDIPGHGMNKINAAFEGGLTGGGPELMAKTVSNLTGLQIDHYLYVDLNGFQEVVNTLGGVDLCIPAYNVNTPGWVEGTRCGREPVADLLRRGRSHRRPQYRPRRRAGLSEARRVPGARLRARAPPALRATIPDFARIGRQQQFMRAVINQMLQAGADREGAGTGRSGAREPPSRSGLPAGRSGVSRRPDARPQHRSGGVPRGARHRRDGRAAFGASRWTRAPSRSSRRSGTASRSRGSARNWSTPRRRRRTRRWR